MEQKLNSSLYSYLLCQYYMFQNISVSLYIYVCVCIYNIYRSRKKDIDILKSNTLIDVYCIDCVMPC